MASKKTVVLPWGKEEKGKGGGRKRIPESDYIARLKDAEYGTSSNNNPRILWKWSISEGRYEGTEIWDRTTMTPKALWTVRRVLESMGVKVPQKKKQRVDLTKLFGREVGITVADGDPYEDNNGKTRIASEIVDYLSADVVRSGGEEDEDADEDELEDDDELEEDDEEVDDEEEDEDDLDSFSRKELKDLIKEDDLDVKVKKSMSDDDLREAIREAQDDEEEDDDEDEDLEELEIEDL